MPTADPVPAVVGTVTVMTGGSIGSSSEDFRSVVLRGQNVASYKFALAKSILTLAESGRDRGLLSRHRGRVRVGRSGQAT